MNIIKRIKSKTSKENRLKGQISTLIGVSCVTVLSLGIVSNPLGIAVLTIGSIFFGGDGVNRALKVGDKNGNGNENGN